MESISIDFDVFKALTLRRAAADVTYNDVLRELLNLPPANRSHSLPAGANGDWVAKGISFPEGTQFRARYKGRMYEAEARASALVYAGKRFKSPSAAAIEITGNSVNGWKFWECRRPGELDWTPMFSLWETGRRR